MKDIQKHSEHVYPGYDSENGAFFPGGRESLEVGKGVG